MNILGQPPRKASRFIGLKVSNAVNQPVTKRVKTRKKK